MDIYTCGSRPTRRGPAESFTGTVWQEPIIEAPAPARVRAGLVRFEPGARTAWHTHPLGQTLFVISGGAAPCERSKAATWSGFRRTRSIGTALPRPRAWFTLRPRRRSTANT